MPHFIGPDGEIIPNPPAPRRGPQMLSQCSCGTITMDNKIPHPDVRLLIGQRTAWDCKTVEELLQKARMVVLCPDCGRMAVLSKEGKLHVEYRPSSKEKE